MDRFRNTFVVLWFGVVAIGIPIFGHGFVWPCIFIAIAYCVVDALVGRSRRPLPGVAQAPENGKEQDNQANQVDAR